MINPFNNEYETSIKSEIFVPRNIFNDSGASRFFGYNMKNVYVYPPVLSNETCQLLNKNGVVQTLTRSTVAKNQPLSINTYRVDYFGSDYLQSGQGEGTGIIEINVNISSSPPPFIRFQGYSIGQTATKSEVFMLDVINLVAGYFVGNTWNTLLKKKYVSGNSIVDVSFFENVEDYSSLDSFLKSYFPKYKIAKDGFSNFDVSDFLVSGKCIADLSNVNIGGGITQSTLLTKQGSNTYPAPNIPHSHGSVIASGEHRHTSSQENRVTAPVASTPITGQDLFSVYDVLNPSGQRQTNVKSHFHNISSTINAQDQSNVPDFWAVIPLVRCKA